MEANKMPISKRMAKDVVYTNGILLSHKKDQNWVIFRHVDVPRHFHMSEVNQRANKYCILMLIWGPPRW